MFYFIDGNFRCYLFKNNIDPNFIIGFFTAIALILSIIQSLSDRKFSYNANLVNSIEDKGLSIIAKLLTIRQKSEILSITIKQIKEAIASGLIYKDSNNALSKEDIEKELEMTTAYIQTYFPEECEAWNSLQDKLSNIATNCSNVLINYELNIDVIKDKNFTNLILDDIDNILIKSESIYKDIDKSAEEMKDRIILKLNDYKGKLKDSFYFKL